MSEAALAEKQYARTKGELSKLLGRSPVTIDDWLSRGCPGKTAQGWDPEAMLEWASRNVREPRSRRDRREPSEGSDAERLLKAQADEKEAKAALAELQLAIERGEYVPHAEVKEHRLALISVFRRGFLALEQYLPPRLEGLTAKEMKVIIRAVAREQLTRLAKL
jgi:phage terminase Nu1 subunit (DNA packaging protein)